MSRNALSIRGAGARARSIIISDSKGWHARWMFYHCTLETLQDKTGKAAAFATGCQCHHTLETLPLPLHVGDSSDDVPLRSESSMMFFCARNHRFSCSESSTNMEELRVGRREQQ